MGCRRRHAFRLEGVVNSRDDDMTLGSRLQGIKMWASRVASSSTTSVSRLALAVLSLQALPLLPPPSASTGQSL